MLKRVLIPGLIVLTLLAGQTIPARAQDVRKAEAVVPATAAAPASLPGVGVPLRDGDTVEIRIANVPPEDIQQFDGTYNVDESGMINLPYIGMIKAGGLPPSQVQTVIQNQLISAGIYTMPTVTVTPPAGARFISVGGQVRGPGRVPYSSDLTLMTTIAAAGGPSDFAGDRIRLVRGGKVQFYSRKRLEKDPSKDPVVEPGDQIELMQSWF
jgi:polysaccharide export outer membrane protein